MKYRWLLELFVIFRGESHIDFRTQSVIMTLGGWAEWGGITNDVL